VPVRFMGEGNGRLRFDIEGTHCVGIYRCEGNRLSICFREVPRDRPTAYRATEDQFLFILHRVKPRK
jgi:hypothetical protein